MGQVILINSLMSSSFVYKISVLPLISDNQCQKFYEMVYNFLWGGKKTKIPLLVLQDPKEKGGLKLCNINPYPADLFSDFSSYRQQAQKLLSLTYSIHCQA